MICKLIVVYDKKADKIERTFSCLENDFYGFVRSVNYEIANNEKSALHVFPEDFCYKVYDVDEETVKLVEVVECEEVIENARRKEIK